MLFFGRFDRQQKMPVLTTEAPTPGCKTPDIRPERLRMRPDLLKHTQGAGCVSDATS
jgi:hypothetical protein